ncbi:hypothetical protein [Nostoc sp. PCC 9305]
MNHLFSAIALSILTQNAIAHVEILMNVRARHYLLVQPDFKAIAHI